jgi:hypothetical protein
MKEDLIDILNKNKKAGYDTININLLIDIINTLDIREEAINYTRCSKQLNESFKEGDKVILDTCINAEIIELRTTKLVTVKDEYNDIYSVPALELKKV